jgi:hypothetical protein
VLGISLRGENLVPSPLQHRIREGQFILPGGKTWTAHALNLIIFIWRSEDVVMKEIGWKPPVIIGAILSVYKHPE